MLRNVIRWMPGTLVLMSALTLTSCERSPKPGNQAAKTSDATKPAASEPAAGVATSNGSAKTQTGETSAAGNDSTLATGQTPNNDTFRPPVPRPRPKLPPPANAQRLSPDFDVWVDPKEGVVLVDGEISLREGMLEMFACTRNTKEHESIISANTLAFLVHAGLLRLGAEVGHPVQFEPEFKPPAGTEIDINVQWRDEAGKEHAARAQELIQDIRTKKQMTHPFVFAGSLFWKDPESGREFYMAESGDFICVSNFASAMLDIPVQSSQANEALEFVAFTERIPPLGTPVRMVLKPKLKKDEKDETKAAERPTAEVSR